LSGRPQVHLDLKSTLLVRGSEARLTQVFLNLVVNAARAESTQGAVQEVHVRARAEHPFAVVEVENANAGVDPSLASRVFFEPFFSTRLGDQAAGLELALARSAVVSLHGSFSFESEVGRGTTFRVALPLWESRRARLIRD
jgi:signal transduction histidine kinase